MNSQSTDKIKFNKSNTHNQRCAEKPPVYQVVMESLEYDTGIRALVNKFLIPILNSLPQSLRKIIVKDKAADKVVEERTSHSALETLYQSGFNVSRPKDFIQSLSRKLWFGTDNAKAVRNRLKIVTTLILNSIKKQARHKERINILSIASGSARAVLNAARCALDSDSNLSLNIVLLDKSEKALLYSRKLAEEYQLLQDDRVNIAWLQGNATQTVIDLFKQNQKFDIVEMVGLLDYFDNDKSISIFKEINKILNDNSMFVTANIQPNREMRFVTKFVDWKMIYRTPHDMFELLVKSGFNPENISLLNEPFNVHVIVMAEK